METFFIAFINKLIFVGIPEPTIIWYFYPFNSAKVKSRKIENAGPFLTIDKPVLQDGGYYQCVIQNTVANGKKHESGLCKGRTHVILSKPCRTRREESEGAIASHYFFLPKISLEV